MATGGPESALALGGSGLIDEAVTPQPLVEEFSTTTTGAPPPIPAAEDPTGRQQGIDIGRPTLNAPQLNQDYRYTQRDFYAPNPTINGQDPRGGAMYMPSFGEVPYAILGSQLQETKRKRAELQAKKEQLLNPKIKETAPQYQQEYASVVNKGIQDLIGGEIEARGGDKSGALEYFVSDPEGIAKYGATVRNLEALGTEVKYVVDEALDKQMAVAKGLEDWSSPEEKYYAERVLRGYSSIGTNKEGDLQQLVNESRQLGRVMSRTKILDERIVPAMQLLSKNTETIGEPYRKNGRWILPVKKVTNYDEAIEGFAREMTIGGQFDHVDEGKEWLRQFMQPEVEVQAIVRDPIQPSGGGSGSPTPASLATTDVTALPSQVSTLSPAGTEEGGEGVMGAKSYPTMNIVDVVAGRGQTPFPRAFRDKGQNVFMVVDRIMNVDGELMLVGKETGEPKTIAIRGEDGEVTEGIEPTDPQTFSKLPDRMIPYEENKGLVKSAWGIGEDQVRNTIGKTSSSVPEFVTKAGYSKSDWDALTDKQRQAILKAGKL